MLDAADYFGGQRLSAREFARLLDEAGVSKICVSLVTGRCGSTYLSEIVMAYGRFGTGREAFNPVTIETWRAHNPTLHSYIRNGFGRRAKAGGVAYFQISPWQFDRLLLLLPESFLEIATFNGIRRRDILAQAISYYFASATGCWHHYGDPVCDAGHVPHDEAVQDVADNIAILMEFEKYISKLAAQIPKMYVGDLFYEDFVREPVEAAASLMTMHGHKPDMAVLRDAFARATVTEKVRYRLFPELYAQALSEIPGMADMLADRIGPGRSVPLRVVSPRVL